MNKSRLAGWNVSGLVAAFLLFSAVMKLRSPEGTDEGLAKIGWTTEVMQKVGIVELACVVLYVVPQTSFVGAILLTGYLGGATATHVRIGESFIFPPLLGVIMWIGYALRRPDVVMPALRRAAPASSSPAA